MVLTPFLWIRIPKRLLLNMTWNTGSTLVTPCLLWLELRRSSGPLLHANIWRSDVVKMALRNPPTPPPTPTPSTHLLPTLSIWRRNRATDYITGDDLTAFWSNKAVRHRHELRLMHNNRTNTVGTVSYRTTTQSASLMSTAPLLSCITRYSHWI